MEAARVGDAPLTFLLGGVAAARPDQLAGAPTAGLVAGARLGADEGAVLGALRRREVAVDLRGAVPRVHLEESLPLGIVLARRQLGAPGCQGRCVDSPGGSVGNHQAGEAPVVQLAQQVLRGGSSFEAVVGQLADRRLIAARDATHLA
jgi:hypothetical protein